MFDSTTSLFRRLRVVLSLVIILWSSFAVVWFVTNDPLVTCWNGNDELYILAVRPDSNEALHYASRENRPAWHLGFVTIRLSTALASSEAALYYIPLTSLFGYPLMLLAAVGLTFNYRGKPHILAVIRDITERKQAEEAILRSQRRIEDLVNSLDGIVWEADAETVQFTFISRQVEHLLGYPAWLWLSDPTFWQDHIHPEDRGWVLPVCAIATEERRSHEFEYRMIAADGRVVWLHDVVTVVEEDNQCKLRGVMVDITARKEAEAALRRRDEESRHHLELRVAERTHELSTLLEISRTIVSTLELKPLLGLILDQLKLVADYSGAAILTLQGTELTYLGYRQPTGHEYDILTTSRFQVESLGRLWSKLCQGEVVVVDDITADDPMAHDYQHSADDSQLQAVLRYVRSWMAVPLLVKDRIVGILTLAHAQSNYYTAYHAELTMAIANLAAQAIENDWGIVPLAGHAGFHFPDGAQATPLARRRPEPDTAGSPECCGAGVRCLVVRLAALA